MEPPPQTPSSQPPPEDSLPVEELARTILQLERLGMDDLPRCRLEVQLQLTHSPPPPLPEIAVPPLPDLATALFQLERSAAMGEPRKRSRLRRSATP